MRPANLLAAEAPKSLSHEVRKRLNFFPKQIAPGRKGMALFVRRLQKRQNIVISLLSLRTDTVGLASSLTALMPRESSPHTLFCADRPRK